MSESHLFAARILLFLTLGLLAWRTWRGAEWWGTAAWAMLALLLASSWLLPWYVVWLLPLAALTPSRGPRLAAFVLTAYLLVVRSVFGAYG